VGDELIDSTSHEVSISPAGILQRALRGWWLVAFCVAAGALAGVAAWSIRPMQYESSFAILSSIDFTNTGELTQFEEDLAMEVVGQILGKQAMLERVTAAARQEGIAIDVVALRDHSSVERRLGTWRVRVRASSPAEAERLAAIWLGFGVEELTQAREHALVADGLKRRQQGLEECLSRSAGVEPSQGMCSPLGLKVLQAQLAESSQLLAEERGLSQGLSSGVVFGEMPAQPSAARRALYGRAEVVLAGGLIGLVIGVWAVQSDWAVKLARRRHAKGLALG
jgi:hypothetical protein